MSSEPDMPLGREAEIPDTAKASVSFAAILLPGRLLASLSEKKNKGFVLP